MKTYFAKYLPVEGEIKAGDEVVINRGGKTFIKTIEYPVYINEEKSRTAEENPIYYIVKATKLEVFKYSKEDYPINYPGGRHYAEEIINIEVEPKDIGLSKLFLCSREINWVPGDDEHILLSKDKNLWGQIEDDSIVPIEISHAYDNDNSVPLKDGEQAEKDTIFKVIGKISPEAIWVKEEDEFDEDEVKLFAQLQSKQLVPLQWIMQKNKDLSYLTIAKIAKIKCPTCKTFH